MACNGGSSGGQAGGDIVIRTLRASSCGSECRSSVPRLSQEQEHGEQHADHPGVVRQVRRQVGTL